MRVLRSYRPVLHKLSCMCYQGANLRSGLLEIPDFNARALAQQSSTNWRTYAAQARVVYRTWHLSPLGEQASIYNVATMPIKDEKLTTQFGTIAASLRLHHSVF